MATTTMEGMAHQYCLRWNNFQNNIASALGSLKAEEDLVDVTLSCGGRIVKAHKVVLSACSPYFREVFKENPCQHPVVILKDVSYEDILSLLSFMYVGEVYITKEQIQTFLQTAELLQIRGLAGVTNLAKEHGESAPPSKTNVPPPLSTLYPKHGVNVADGGAQLKHALISKRSRTSTASSAASATATIPSGTSSSAPSPPPASPPLGRTSAPSSPQQLVSKRRKAVPRRVSTSSSGSGLPGETNTDALRGSGSSSGCPPGEDGDSMERLMVKQEVEDVDLKEDVDDLGGPENDNDGDSRGEDRPYYLDSDPDGEAGTSSSLLARSLAGGSPRAGEGAVLIPAGSMAASNNQTIGADLTVDLDRDGIYRSWAPAGPAGYTGSLYEELPQGSGPPGGEGGTSGIGYESSSGSHYQSSSSASNWGCMQPRSCPMCHRTFSNKFNLKQHIENVHSPGKPVPCQICNRFFKNKWYLRKHCVTTHNAPLRRIKTPWGKIMYVSDSNYDDGPDMPSKLEARQESRTE